MYYRMDNKKLSKSFSIKRTKRLNFQYHLVLPRLRGINDCESESHNQDEGTFLFHCMILIQQARGPLMLLYINKIT